MLSKGSPPRLRLLTTSRRDKLIGFANMQRVPRPSPAVHQLTTREDCRPRKVELEPIFCFYEEDFVGFSYGFRPGRSQHQALDALWVGIMRKKVNWILDADIRGFFDHLSHEWLVKFVEHRIADRRILRLIQKWLRAGVTEEGEWSKTEGG